MRKIWHFVLVPHGTRGWCSRPGFREAREAGESSLRWGRETTGIGALLWGARHARPR